MSFWDRTYFYKKDKDIDLMFDEYDKLVKDYGIADTFDKLKDLPYSRKFKILKNLLNKYSRITVNSALFIYDTKYIEKNNINYIMIEKVLISICKSIKR